MVMANKFFYRKYAELLLSRPANDQAEIDDMNLKMKCADGICTLTGYGRNVSKTCAPISSENDPEQNPEVVYQFACQPDSGSPGTAWENLG